jgi:hypothetical protein
MRLGLLVGVGLVALLAACGAQGPALPVGTWTIDEAAARPLAEQWIRKQVDAAPAAERDAARRRLDETVSGILKASLRVNLLSDGAASVHTSRNGRETRFEGRWTERDGMIRFVSSTRDGAPASASDARPVQFRLRDGRLWFEVQLELELPLRRE